MKLVALVAVAVAAFPATAEAAWFKEAANIPTLTPPVNRAGDPTAGTASNEGGEAAAVFDANGDGTPDVVIANGSAHYFVALGHRTAGGVRFRVSANLIGVTGDGRMSVAKALGLTDFNADGKLDLYLANNGDGTLSLDDPRDLSRASDPTNLRRATLTRDHRFRTYLNRGGGRFAYEDVGADARGTTRSALFSDFDGDGRTDLFAFAAPYFGIWWGGDSSPSQLLPGRAGGRFGRDRLGRSIVGPGGKRRHPFEDALGRGKIDVKGAVARDFDGDGRTDVIGGAYADVWDSVGTPPLAQAQAAGAAIDLDHDGKPDGGWQGAWKHGIFALRNVSRPGRIRFEDDSASATDQGIGFGDRMHVYETMPIDFNHDGRLDLVATGVRNFTAFGSLEHNTPLIQVYRNDSRPGRLRFTNVTRRSGLDFMNHNDSLRSATGGRFPIELPGLMLGGGPLVLTPLLSAGAVIDVDNDGEQDLVMIDRQFMSRNPLNGQEFSLWVFRGRGGGRFKMIDPARHGLAHTARDIAYGDFNGDGRTDLVTVNGSGGGQTVDDNNFVFLNTTGSRNRWIDLKVRAAGRRNPLGLGARVAVYRAGTRKLLGYDELRTDFAYRSRRDAILHFGLGRVRRVDVRVSGLGRPFTVRGLRADGVRTIRRPR